MPSNLQDLERIFPLTCLREIAPYIFGVEGLSGFSPLLAYLIMYGGGVGVHLIFVRIPVHR